MVLVTRGQKSTVNEDNLDQRTVGLTLLWLPCKTEVPVKT